MHTNALLMASTTPPCCVTLAPNLHLVQLEFSVKVTSPLTTPTPSSSVTVRSPASNGGFPSRGRRIFLLNSSVVKLSSGISAFSATISSRKSEVTRAFVAASRSSIAIGEPSSDSILENVNIIGGGEFTKRSFHARGCSIPSPVEEGAFSSAVYRRCLIIWTFFSNLRGRFVDLFLSLCVVNNFFFFLGG